MCKMANEISFPSYFPSRHLTFRGILSLRCLPPAIKRPLKVHCNITPWIPSSWEEARAWIRVRQALVGILWFERHVWPNHKSSCFGGRARLDSRVSWLGRRVRSSLKLCFQVTYGSPPLTHRIKPCSNQVAKPIQKISLCPLCLNVQWPSDKAVVHGPLMLPLAIKLEAPSILKSFSKWQKWGCLWENSTTPTVRIRTIPRVFPEFREATSREVAKNPASSTWHSQATKQKTKQCHHPSKPILKRRDH